MAIFLAILDFLFGCHHVHLSRVFTLHGETYRVCCDCGAKFTYSLKTMSIEHRLPLTPVLTRFRMPDMEKEHGPRNVHSLITTIFPLSQSAATGSP